MHYFLDGYNMLFRLLHGDDNLQSQREAFIYDLNKKIALVQIDVSIVFDATFQMGGRSRSHYDALEILYTAEGETADEYILDELKNALHPQQETVVTSDKKLAWRARNRSAHTESVEEFMEWLNRSYKNKLRRLKKEQPPSSSQAAPLPLTKTPSNLPLIPSKEAPLEAYTDYYTQVFESEWQEIVKKEEISKQAKPTPSKRPPRKPRRPSDPFAPPPTPEAKEATEMERWLKAFEKRLLDSE